MLADAIFLVLLALSTLLLQLVGLPLILAFFGKSPSQPEWWAWGRMTAWLTIGITLWLVAHLGIPANTAVGFWGVFLALGIGAYAKKSWGTRERVRRFLRTHGRAILFQELLFLFGFLFLGLVRTFHPQVLDLEKFMNAGYMQGYLRSPTLPAEDMWLAGETINYYSFGQFLGSLILRFWGVPVEIGFNALLGLMMGLVLLQSFSLSRTLLRPWLKESKKKAVSVPLLVAGLVGAALIVFGGNSHPAWYFLKHHTFEGYWYPDVTRFIEYSIHEIPAYSFVVSDYHAHFLDLPIVLCTVWVAWQWLQRLMEQRPNGWKGVLRNRSALVASLVLGALLGIMGMTNTWDMLIYGVFLGVIAGLAFVWFPHSLPALMISSVPIAVGAAITFLPWFLNFSSIVNGVFWVKERTELWQFLVLWTGHIVMTVLVAGIGGALFRKRHAPPRRIFVSYGDGFHGPAFFGPAGGYLFQRYLPDVSAREHDVQVYFSVIYADVLVGGLGAGVVGAEKDASSGRTDVVFTGGRSVFFCGRDDLPFFGVPGVLRAFSRAIELGRFAVAASLRAW